METRNGLVAGGSVTPASGTAEREAALDLLDKHRPPGGKGGGRRITLGPDKGYDVAAFVEELRDRRVTPHTAVREPPRQDPLARAAQGGGLLHPGARRLQSRATTRAVGAGPAMTPAMTPDVACAVVGKWRIVEADPWDRDYLDPVEPASLTFEGDGHGEFAFGGVQGGLDREYSRRIIIFTWQGFDEMDEAGGDGAVELDDDGSPEIEFRYRLGDEAILKAHK